MSFPPAQQTPTSIGAVKIELIDQDGVPANMIAYYEVDVLDQNGERIIFPGTRGILIPHLTQAQIDGLISFMQAMRTKAESEFLA